MLALPKTPRFLTVPTPRGAHLLAQVRCAVINGDLATKLAAYRARIHEVPEDVTSFSRSCSTRQKRNPTLFNSPLPMGRL